MNTLLFYVRRFWAHTGDWLGTKLQRNFFLYLAAFFTLIVLIDAGTANRIGGMREKSFDMMVKHRVWVRKPDSDIVIVDIDEKSLAALAADYGRWPWPRQVLAEFVEKINQQQPDAIVFDILFSDPDVFNPDSDAYFNETIARSNNTWFPMVRLDATQDSQSQLKISRIPGVTPVENISSADTDSTIALLLPYFDSIQRSARIGTNNIWPDADGIAREYAIARTEKNYRIPSLPLAVARAKEPALQAPDNMLVNWRGLPFSYHYTSFSDVFLDFQKQHPQRNQHEFTGKIVIIGSTAPSLFDIKATPVSKQFPGAEILATAIDNLRHHDWLRVPQNRLLYLIGTLLILWLTAYALYKQGPSNKLDKFYGFSQFLLMGIGYALINLANIYVNFTGPVMLGFAYYSIARFYAFATARALDESVVVRNSHDEKQSTALLLSLRFDVATREEGSIARLAEALRTETRCKPSMEWISGRQKGLWRLFENTLVLCWRVGENDPDVLARIRNDAQHVQDILPAVLQRLSLTHALPLAHLKVSQAEGLVSHGGDDVWRALLGKSLQ